MQIVIFLSDCQSQIMPFICFGLDIVVNQHWTDRG